MASIPASGSQEHLVVAPAAGGEDYNDELLELLDMEAGGLQASWNQHGGRSIAKQLAACDGPPPQAADEIGIQRIIAGQAGSSGSTQQNVATANATNDNAMRARLNRARDESATLGLQAKARRKRRR